MEAKSLSVGNIIGRIYYNPAPTGITKEVSVVEVKEIREESVNVTAKGEIEE